MFAYCGNNPVNRIDPTGHAWWHWVAAAAIVVVAAAAVVVTAGGAAAAVAAVASVASGVAAATTASTVAAGVFIGTSTALAVSAYSAAANSNSAEEFAGYGASALTSTVTGGVFGGDYGYSLSQSQNYSNSSLSQSQNYSNSSSSVPSEGICFVAGTMVKMQDGHIPIEEIVVGDYVWAWSEDTNEVDLKPVVETYVNETRELIHVFVNGEEIITTPSHPFYSPLKGWTSAVKLRAGDILVLVNGEYVVVEKIQHEILETPVVVYNFQVAEYHTYFVAQSCVLVHNSCGTPFDENQQAVLDIAKEYKNTGISQSEGNILVEWANEYGISNHGPMIHDGRGGIWGTLEHIKIKNYHIQVW